MSDTHDLQVLGWCIIELLGHVKIGGFVTEEERFGTKLGRIDIYGPNGEVVTQYFSGNSIYRVTPVSEDIAKQVGGRGAAPVRRWELKAVAPAPEPSVSYDVEPDDDDEPPF
jgi:hypothetical protein